MQANETAMTGDQGQVQGHLGEEKCAIDSRAPGNLAVETLNRTYFGKIRFRFPFRLKNTGHESAQ